MQYDVEELRARFPALHQLVHNRPLVYLDNAATTQKPQIVLDTLVRYYTEDNSNIHRGVHTLSERATAGYEAARVKVQRFLNAADNGEIIFTRNATESINLVAAAWGRTFLQAGDEVLITAMEHHANIVPWQMICEERGSVLRVIPITDEGELEPGAYEKLLGPRTKMVAITQMSNALGTVNPVREMTAAAHAVGARVLIDGAQAAYHLRTDVQALDCDFFVFSGHKLYGPTGIGILYGKREVLEAMRPYQGGGDMIDRVTFEKTTYNGLPYKFEAGTPHIAGAIGLGAAVDFIESVGIEHMAAHEQSLLQYGTELLEEIPGLRIIGKARHKASILSFVLNDIHPSDIGAILDQEGIAIRTGHHCAQPVMDRYGVPATARASLACYNTREELEALARGIHKVRKVMA